MEMNQRNFKKDKARVDKFEPQIKSICGQVFIKTAPKRVDCEEATDLLVLELNTIRIACRIRNYRYYLKYPTEFTIRTSRPSGAKTELEKIMAGWCDYNFYGFADENDEYIKAWLVGDLKIFRREYYDVTAHDLGKVHTRCNHDRSSNFMGFEYSAFSNDFIVKTNSKKILYDLIPMIEAPLDAPANIDVYEKVYLAKP